jgi:predicted nucleotide-binding protein (sugar kinase/HSP70/actin superfamily)
MTAATQAYQAYSPRPFQREERGEVEVLFGGLHWRLEKVIQAVFENVGCRARPLPTASKADLLLGRELADIGQCCPTSFVTGNLANFLKSEAARIGPEKVADKYIYLTAGSCGACRFGQYHQSYELALRNLGLDAFRLFLMAQDNLDQGAFAGGGLEIDLPFSLGTVWAVLCTDLLQSLEYKTRPYEVVAGQTDAVVRESVDYLCEVFRNRPNKGKKWGALVWHLSTDYFLKALREVFGKFAAIEVDRLQAKPIVKITGEFYLQTVEGDPNYNIHRWLEAEGAEVYPAAIAVWLDYWFRYYVQETEAYVGVDRSARLKVAKIRGLQKIFGWTYNRMRAALGNIPHEMPDQYELRRLAAPYFHHQMSGGEGDMLVGKALWSHLNKKAHMICELSPYACMPNTMSVGAMAGAVAKHPDLLYAPLEIKGDAEVHALSRCQMILTEAKKRAKSEFADALVRTGMTAETARARLDHAPAIKKATYRVPHADAVGTGANLVLHLAQGAFSGKVGTGFPQKMRPINNGARA